MSRILARLTGIERRFGPVVALNGADLELRGGEVHGVLGANGAGKSTLLNILGGMLRPDAGRVEIDGEEVALTSPRDAWACGIGLVHQHFTLVPTLTVLENLALGSRGPAAAPRTVRAQAERIMERTGLHIPLHPRVESLGVGDRQRIEILKALLRDPRVLVLDEPTAVLTPEEIEGLFGLLRDLAGEGRAVALVVHKIDEVMDVADRVTVLRSGRTVLSAGPAERSTGDFVRAMVGDDAVDPIALGLGEATEDVGEGPREPGEETGGSLAGSETRTVARVEAVTVEDARGPRVRDVTLEVAAGEVLGIAGVEGNGQRELALVLAGRMPVSRGSVRLPDAVGFISQDRSSEGLIADFDLRENVALALQRKAEYRRGPWLRWDRLEEAAETIRSRYDVTAPSIRTAAGSLSGGNQQRVVVGRELAMASQLLVAENPTRGLDIAASAFVHEELRRLVSQGVGVVLLSTDLDEILALSDRIFAIARGSLVEVAKEEWSREGVGAYMLGGTAEHG
ncbi:MAG: ABC transporter ATP-binding protein [Longimicrobiales bacterium]|nr:ABC transporter ATP-binding protein [Longimicrobiales bacterium]